MDTLPYGDTRTDTSTCMSWVVARPLHFTDDSPTCRTDTWSTLNLRVPLDDENTSITGESNALFPSQSIVDMSPVEWSILSEWRPIFT